jgi:hypothetical protein
MRGNYEQIRHPNNSNLNRHIAIRKKATPNASKIAISGRISMKAAFSA